MMINGIRVHLTDTAGLRDTTDPIERIGVERSEMARKNADIALLILDGSREMIKEEMAWLCQLQETDAVIINKSDLDQMITEDQIHAMRPDIKCMVVSALDPISLEPVRAFFRENTEIADRIMFSQPRHLNAVKRAIASLNDAVCTLREWTPDMSSTDLQAAQNALSEITGDHADEKLLDTIFSSFCVGK